MEAIRLLPVGSSVSRKLDFLRLSEDLSLPKTPYRVDVLEPITDLPLPLGDHPPYTASLQYRAEQLFALVDSIYSGDVSSIICAVIDHEVYNELFSTVNAAGTIVVVSTRNSTLHAVLSAAQSGLAQYVVLELAVQMLAVTFRRIIEVGTPDPERCDPPWHLDRRGCLFDYFGISPNDVQKLTKPQFCAQCTEMLANRPELVAELAKLDELLSFVSDRAWTLNLRRFLGDPINAFAAGALAGITPSLFKTSTFAEVASVALILLLLGRSRRGLRP
jgi:hypothetical protein